MSAIVLRGDARELPLPDNSVDLIVTSPPYFGLRSYTDNVKCLRCIEMERDGRDVRQAWPDYDAHVHKVHVQHYDGQVGSEATPGEYVAALVGCTREWVRVLKPCGSLFVNLGDKYAGDSSPGGASTSTLIGQARAHLAASGGRRVPGRSKSLLGLPWRYALACADQLGLILRAEIIWAKPNGLPESVTDRVRRAHEQVFHFTVRPRYYSAVDEIREPQKYPGDVGRDSRGPKLIAMPDGHHDRPEVRAMHPLGKLPGSVWNIPSQPLTVPPALGVDHFAAFPMELPRRIILGWSPPGVCVACGEGRRPVVASERTYTQRTYNGSRSGASVGNVTNSIGRQHAWLPGRNEATITGYACACAQPDAPTRPATVLDPFGGTGTTALLACALGRNGISVDRSADYCRLAAWRTQDPAERARALEVPKPPPVPQGMDALF